VRSQGVPIPNINKDWRYIVFIFDKKGQFELVYNGSGNQMGDKKRLSFLSVQKKFDSIPQPEKLKEINHYLQQQFQKG